MLSKDMTQNQYLPEEVLIPFFGIKKPIVGVEIGVLGGIGSFMMLNKMPNLKLYCIDPWKHFKGHGFEAENDQNCHDINYEMAKDRLKVFGERAIILRMTSDEAMNYVKEKVDFVHIDGDHRYEQVKKDVRNWQTKLKPISILSGHDWNNDDVQKAIKEETEGKIQTGEDLVWYKIYGIKYMDKELKKILTSVIFHNLRIMHGVTPRDTYIHNYLWHLEREGDEFFDTYHLGFWWGSEHRPKKIMEIGPRSGTSLIQLLSSFVEFKDVRVVLFDMWNDGLCTPELIRKHLKHLSIPIDFVEFYTGDSKITVPEFKKTNKDKFDWILVDGSHNVDDAAKDLENVVDLVADGGMIVMDDIRPQPLEGMDLSPVWENFKKKHFNEFEWYEDLHGKGVGWGIRKIKTQEKTEKKVEKTSSTNSN